MQKSRPGGRPLTQTSAQQKTRRSASRMLRAMRHGHFGMLSPSAHLNTPMSEGPEIGVVGPGAGVECYPLCQSIPQNPSLLADCYGRRETYKIDTRVVTAPLEPLVFEGGDLVLDQTAAGLLAAPGSQGSRSRWLLEVKAFSDPALYLRFKKDAAHGRPSWFKSNPPPSLSSSSSALHILSQCAC